MSSSTTAAPVPTPSAWISRFDGPILHRTITFGSPLIRHQYRRSFEHVGRNVHMVSVFGRVLLGAEKITEAERAIYKRIEEITTAMDRKAAAIAVVMKDAGISDEAMATYNKPATSVADIVVPAQSKFLNLLECADRYAQGFFTLWLAGEMDDTEKSKLEFELKKLIRSIPATTRKMRIFIQAKLNESEHEEAKKEAAALVAEVGDDDSDADDALPLDADGKPLPAKVKGGTGLARSKAQTKAPSPVSVVEAPVAEAA